jgi:hypothetical protein
MGLRAALDARVLCFTEARQKTWEGVTVGFVEDAESADGQKFLVVLVLPDLTTSLHLVTDVDKLLRQTGTPSGAVPMAVFQAERESFAEHAGLKPVFPQTVDFGWAADKLSKAPVVPAMLGVVGRYLARLDMHEVAGVVAAWAAGAPADVPRLSYREAAALKEWDDADWRDYLDD